jgi:curved DNA-binding protein CbpA
MNSTYYELLGVNWLASTEQIKQAYRDKAKSDHPDAGGSAELFDTVGSVYQLLTDKHERNRYNLTLRAKYKGCDCCKGRGKRPKRVGWVKVGEEVCKVCNGLGLVLK